MQATQQEKATSFRALHEGPPFVIPNPWDAGSARVFAALGFEALATTSSGFAFTLGRPDGGATLEEVVAHVRALAGATELPLSVDLENGYGPEPGDAAAAEQAAKLDLAFTLTARAENHIRGNPDLDDTIARLRAFERAGADVLYAPGLRDGAEIRAVCEAVGKPVNVLARPSLTMEEIAAAAERIRDEGDFSGLGSMARVGEWLQ